MKLKPSFPRVGVFPPSQTKSPVPTNTPRLPSHLRRYQQARDLSFVAYSYYICSKILLQ